ncbi:MAG: NAD(P)H-hydrate epimerase [Planctomycetia bacterium]|nr:NAD(P)H-hydrate epimerase [Planctomycetia bacterium]
MPAENLTREQVRDIDRRAITEYGMTGLVLMENAGRGCADLLCQLGINGPIMVCCGKGNNGGDGFVIARHLDLRGFDARVLLLCNPAELSGDAAANYKTLETAELPIFRCPENNRNRWLNEQLAGAEWIVDALLGTGSRGTPRPPFDLALREMNTHAAKKLAVDLPSGLDCDTGTCATPTFRADHTCTFVAPKIGFREPGAKPFLGVVHVLDIGAPRKLVQEFVSSQQEQPPREL